MGRHTMFFENNFYKRGVYGKQFLQLKPLYTQFTIVLNVLLPIDSWKTKMFVLKTITA